MYSLSSTAFIKPSEVIETTRGSSLIKSSSEISPPPVKLNCGLLSSPNFSFNSINSVFNSSSATSSLDNIN